MTSADLEELLIEWEELRRAGQVLPADEMCDDPILAARLQEAIEHLLQFDDVFGSLQQETTSHSDTLDNRRLLSTSSFATTTLHDRGGRGEIYQAEHAELRRKVAVKCLNPHAAKDPELATRFRFEAEATSQLDHPGVAPVYSVGETDDGRLFYAMRFVRGRNLEQVIEAFHQRRWKREEAGERRQAFNALVRHLVSAAKTIAYAHQRSILNLDIKPRNIMVGRYGETLVVDWGESAALDDAEFVHLHSEGPLPVASGLDTSSSSIAGGGTLPYMAPERMPGTAGPIGKATDVYSLGATLYRTITGKDAFGLPNSSKAETIRLIERGDYARPSEVASEVPPALEAICMKAMAFAPRERYASALELAEDLERWLDDEPVLAYRESRFERLARWIAHHQMETAAIVTGLTVTLVLVAAAGVVWSSVRSAQHANEMRQAAEQRKTQEEQRRATAEQRFDAAIATFEQLSASLANEENNNLSIVTPLAEDVVAFTDSCLNDPDIVQSGQRYARLLELRSLLGELSLEDLQQANAIYTKLLGNRDDADLLWRLSRNELRIGRELFRRDQLQGEQGALEWLNQAGERIGRMRRLQPFQERERRLQLTRHEAEVHHARGELYLKTGRQTPGTEQEAALHSSERQFLHGRDLRKELVDVVAGKSPADQMGFARDLARSHGYLGDLYVFQGRIRDAEDSYEESLRIRSQLHSRNVFNPEHKFQYARGLENFGVLEKLEIHNLPRAIERVTKATQLQEELVEAYPNRLDFLVDRGRTLGLLIELHVFAASFATSSDEAENHLADAATLIREARKVYASGWQDPRFIRGGLLVEALRAELMEDPQEVERTARAALSRLEAFLDGHAATHDDHFVKALLLGCLGDASDLVLVLDGSVRNGANTVARFEAHRRFGMRCVEDDETSRSDFEDLVNKAKPRISGRN